VSRAPKRALLAVWFAGMVLVSAGLLARHVVALPTPHVNAASFDLLRTDAQRNRWLAVHVLYGDCRCSQRVADHLATTERPSDWVEMVLWVGDAPPAALASRFDVRSITSADLAGLGIEAAPSMVIIAPDGVVHYAGGYTDRKQGPVIEDRRIMADARDVAMPVASLPVFGCAVSARLQRDLAALPTL
jgi:hypothetical protein